MIILGIGGLGYRDAAAALVVDGRLVAAVAEERFTGRKHQGGWPRRAVEWCLRSAGVAAADVQRVAVANNPWVPLRERLLGWYGDAFFQSREFRVFHIFHDEIHGPLLFLKEMEDLSAGRPGRVEVVRHHLSHMAAGYYASDVDEAAILVMDGRGEVSTSSLGVGRGAALEAFRVEEMPNSLGLLSASVADYLGFGEQDDEFRIMSISATGEPRFRAEFAEIVRLVPEGTYALNPDFFSFHEGRAVLSERFLKVFGAPRVAGAPVEARHRDIASSLQGALEDAALHMAGHLAARTKAKALVVSGSLAQNWALNGRLAREAPFERVIVPPYCGDDGTAVGAALRAAATGPGGERPAPVPSPALGPDLPAAEIEETLAACGLPSTRPPSVAAETARLLAEGRIVGWARGRAEFGPRALGRRSILASAADPALQERLRRTVKTRESHHPFGVAMTRTEAERTLERPVDGTSMLVPARVRASERDRFRGLVLADGSVRLQVVDAEENPEFHAVLLDLGRRTGVAAAVNTSLNLPGRPPATGPREALECLYTTGMDALVLGDRLLGKRGAPA